LHLSQSQQLFEELLRRTQPKKHFRTHPKHRSLITPPTAHVSIHPILLQPIIALTNRDQSQGLRLKIVFIPLRQPALGASCFPKDFYSDHQKIFLVIMSEPPANKRRKRDQIPQSVVEQSGDPSQPATFFSNVENENQTAGYLGLQHTSNLRQLAVTYPVLQAFMSFVRVGANARSHTTLVLLADNEKQYDVDDAETRWPTTPEHPNLSHNKAARIATILIKLRQALEAMAKRAPAEAQKLQDEANATLSKEHQKLAVAVINHEQQKIQVPALGPHETESAVEPYNRCWALMKYFQHQSHASKNVENFKEGGLSKGAPVKPDSIPAWLRPKAPGADTIPVRTAVTTADSLSKKSFSVVWLSELDSGDLEIALGEHEDLERPSSKQYLTTDPRLFKTSMGFRDQIRRQYSCVDLHMQLHKCRLDYQSEGCKMHANFLQIDWKEAKKLLNDDQNSEYVFKKGFSSQRKDKMEKTQWLASSTASLLSPVIVTTQRQILTALFGHTSASENNFQFFALHKLSVNTFV
ncbi:hypothetical protein KCU65_g144, partial [Aureobasidium melanogenum]